MGPGRERGRSPPARDALNKCLSEIEQEGIRSVYIVCIDQDGKTFHYSGGPDVGTIRQASAALQAASFRIIERMIG